MQQLKGSRRMKVIMTAVIVGGVGIGFAAAGLASAGETKAAAPTVNCPDVASQLPAIPAQAQAEVDRNLALLQTQINEANRRLVTSQGEGGANFINNAILGPLEDKRVATINRIATAIGRNAAKPQGLAESLAACSLNEGGAAGGGSAPATTPAAPATTAPAEAGGGNAAVGTITCPDVASQLPAIPAQAQAEVTRNLALLQTQIAEAQRRLESSVGQGGPAFVQNAILGPLADKRASTIDRIAIAIGRVDAKPQGLGSLSTCSVQ